MSGMCVERAWLLCEFNHRAVIVFALGNQPVFDRKRDIHWHNVGLRCGGGTRDDETDNGV